MDLEHFDNSLSESELAEINTLLPLLYGDNSPIVRKADLQMVMSGGLIILAVEGNNNIVSDMPWKRVVGMGTITFTRKIPGIAAQIDDVIVLKEYQGQGIARKIVIALIEEAKRRGVKQINLTARQGNTAANHLYQSIGFVLRETNVYRLTL